MNREIRDIIDKLVFDDIEENMETAMKDVIQETITASMKLATDRRHKEDERLAKMGMARVGYWYSKDEPHYPMPIEGESVDNKDVIINYLRDANVFCAYRGYSGCRLCDLRTNGTRDMTDGKYIWPEGLAHYVEAHNTPLPQFFIDHIMGSVPI